MDKFLYGTQISSPIILDSVTPSPIDPRLSVTTDEMNYLKNNNKAYEGLTVWNTTDKCEYLLKDGNWVKVSEVYKEDLSNYYNIEEIENRFLLKSDAQNTYATKEELGNISTGGGADLSNYYTKEEVEGKIPDTSKFLTVVPAGYATEAYCDEEVANTVSPVTERLNLLEQEVRTNREEAAQTFALKSDLETSSGVNIWDYIDTLEDTIRSLSDRVSTLEAKFNVEGAQVAAAVNSVDDIPADAAEGTIFVVTGE